MKKEKKRITIVLLWLMAIFLIVSVSFLIKLTRGLKSSVYGKIERANFVVIGNENKLFLISVSSQDGAIFGLPTYKEIMNDNKEKKGYLTARMVQENLFLPVNGYFFDTEVDNSSLERNTLSNIFWKGVRRKVLTNLSKNDLLILWFKSKKIKKDKMIIDSWTDNSKSIFKDNMVREESFSIEVLNATDHDGMAQKTAILLENIGGRVVRKADFPKKYDNCQILASPNSQNSYTLNTLQLALNCWVGKLDENGRADISVILGEDYWKKSIGEW